MWRSAKQDTAVLDCCFLSVFCHLTDLCHAHMAAVDVCIYVSVTCFPSVVCCLSIPAVNTDGEIQSAVQDYGEEVRDRWREKDEKSKGQMCRAKGKEKRTENKRRSRSRSRERSERQSELCQMDKCQRELHRPSELSSPSQNAMCKSRSRGPWPAFP